MLTANNDKAKNPYQKVTTAKTATAKTNQNSKKIGNICHILLTSVSFAVIKPCILSVQGFI